MKGTEQEYEQEFFKPGNEPHRGLRELREGGDTQVIHPAKAELKGGRESKHKEFRRLLQKSGVYSVRWKERNYRYEAASKKPSLTKRGRGRKRKNPR